MKVEERKMKKRIGARQKRIPLMRPSKAKASKGSS